MTLLFIELASRATYISLVEPHCAVHKISVGPALRPCKKMERHMTQFTHSRETFGINDYVIGALTTILVVAVGFVSLAQFVA